MNIQITPISNGYLITVSSPNGPGHHYVQTLPEVVAEVENILNHLASMVQGQLNAKQQTATGTAVE